MKKKQIIIVSILIVLIVSVVFFIKNNNGSKSKTISKVGEKFYENFYYNTIEKGKEEDFLKNFKDTGLKVSLSNILNVTKLSKKEKKIISKCNKEKTEITITPKKPYGRKDYKIEVSINCK